MRGRFNSERQASLRSFLSYDSPQLDLDVQYRQPEIVTSVRLIS